MFNRGIGRQTVAFSLNPFLFDLPENYEWPSYSCYVNQGRKILDCLSTSEILSKFRNIWIRCHTHLARNVQDHISKAINKVLVAQDIRSILQATDLETAQFLLNRFADRWIKQEPKLVHWAQINIPQGFQALSLTPKLRRSLRISNFIERSNREIKRRSTVVRIFPNIDSCLRLVPAILIEFNDDWSAGKRLFSL